MPVGTVRAERSRSQPRIPVPMETKRILRPESEAESCGAAREVGCRIVAFAMAALAAAPTAAAPALMRTKLRREIWDVFNSDSELRQPFSTPRRGCVYRTKTGAC